jgi:protein-S-isoprenylcysteine O-methyltransferase Ste14
LISDTIIKTVRELILALNPFKILLKIPVPWVYVLTYLLGLIPQFIFPISIHSHTVLFFLKTSGVFLFAFGASLAAWSLIIFHKANTTTTPGEKSAKLIMTGPYRFSRNPMYVSLLVAYLGEAGLLAQLWPVIFLPLAFAYVNWIVIPLEEAVLTDDFKDEYINYCKSVHRWL